ncbi:hypothetical protein OG884_13345 [Streptosporangium sp. NBC_01755]|uniref:hypothetical protein n=1 Tax=Streptosporangium sp. NBC_01755 TaxID=2975949 RepID=UPI002DDBB4E6|nr:hypothetical protein [Streptosporangium sp. NBC_01755]WSD02841.1 hypothetical protein OG884_13345 [Streptosporangium sp. NBC_01755]
MRISPVIPTVANLLLAVLWGFSVFAGWGPEAFCSDPGCAARLDGVARASALFAVIAACCTAGAWLVLRIRGDENRFTALMTTAVITWVIAESVFFAGGPIVR